MFNCKTSDKLSQVSYYFCRIRVVRLWYESWFVFGQRSFHIAAPAVWNQLPAKLRSGSISRDSSEMVWNPISSQKPTQASENICFNSVQTKTNWTVWISVSVYCWIYYSSGPVKRLFTIFFCKCSKAVINNETLMHANYIFQTAQ